MNKFSRVIDGYGTIRVCYQGTYSLHIEKKHRVKVNVADLVGKYLCRGKEGYEAGGIFNGFLLAPKNQNLFEFVWVRYCCTAQYVKMFHAYEKTIRQKKFFEMLEVKKSYAELPLSRKKCFEKGVVAPSKVRESDSCKDDEVCMKYELKSKQTKVFLASVKGQVNRAYVY